MNKCFLFNHLVAWGYVQIPWLHCKCLRKLLFYKFVMFSTDLILLFFFFKFISSQQEPMPCQNDDGNQIQGFSLDRLKKKKIPQWVLRKSKTYFALFFFYELLELFRANLGSSNFFFCAGYMVLKTNTATTDLRSLHEN